MFTTRPRNHSNVSNQEDKTKYKLLVDKDNENGNEGKVKNIKGEDIFSSPSDNDIYVQYKGSKIKLKAGSNRITLTRNGQAFELDVPQGYFDAFSTALADEALTRGLEDAALSNRITALENEPNVVVVTNDTPYSDIYEVCADGTKTVVLEYDDETSPTPRYTFIGMHTFGREGPVPVFFRPSTDVKHLSLIVVHPQGSVETARFEEITSSITNILIDGRTVNYKGLEGAVTEFKQGASVQLLYHSSRIYSLCLLNENAKTVGFSSVDEDMVHTLVASYDYQPSAALTEVSWEEASKKLISTIKLDYDSCTYKQLRESLLNYMTGNIVTLFKNEFDTVTDKGELKVYNLTSVSYDLNDNGSVTFARQSLDSKVGVEYCFANITVNDDDDDTVDFVIVNAPVNNVGFYGAEVVGPDDSVIQFLAKALAYPATTILTNADGILLRPTEVGEGTNSQGDAASVITFSATINDKIYTATATFTPNHVDWTWNEVSLSGLSSVAHDNTLTGDGTVESPLSVVGGGTSSPSTLFKTVADMQAASLNVGDVVETQRFYPFSQRVFDDDQPGGCQYRIINNPSSTDLSEGLGKDLIQLNNGLYAKANLFNEAYPEQIGYKLQYGPTNGVDLTPYIQRLARIGVTHIKLNRTGHYNGPDAQNAVYRIKDKCELNRSIRISGTHASASGHSTVVSFTPSASNTEKVMFECNKRDIILEDLILNNPSTADISNNGTCIKISDDGSSHGTSSLGNQFYRLNIQGFKYGIYGGSGFLWHVSVNHCVWAKNYINVRLERLVYTTKFYNCLFNTPLYRSVEVGSPFTLQFDTCNFGVRPSNDCILHVERWSDPAEQPPVNERDGAISFVNSQIEYEEAGEDVSADVGKGKFVYCEDNAITSLFFTNCIFINTPLARANNYAVRLFSLGKNSTASFKGCLGPLSDVDITSSGYANYFLEKDFDKLFFDESRPCRKIIGGISVERCYGIDPLPLIPNSHLSSVIVDGGTILTSNNTNIDEFYKVPEGVQMLNLDEKKVQMFTAGKLVNINTLPSNLVRVGKELYEYITIDGRLWITRNLNLRTPNRNNTFWNHLNFGQYYKSDDIVNIESQLPSGWRIPLDADINLLVGDNSASRARALQSRDYQSVWSNATNSLGFNMTPSYYWKRPSQAAESIFNTGFLFGQVVPGVGRRNIWLRENDVRMGGWQTSDLHNLYVPVRVCADA